MSTETIVRPNGKPYIPRKVVAEPWEDQDEHERGCMVLGTHDVERAQRLADESCQYWYGMAATEPAVGWYRLGYDNGQLRWVRDPVKGRAGVSFTATDAA